MELLFVYFVALLVLLAAGLHVATVLFLLGLLGRSSSSARTSCSRSAT